MSYKSFAEAGINGLNGGASETGEIRTTCPECSADRRKKDVKCLSVNVDKGTWLCHHCGWVDGLKNHNGKGNYHNSKSEKRYVKPEYNWPQVLPRNVFTYIVEERCIPEHLIEKNRIGFSKGAITFPFYKSGEVVNIKYRKLDKYDENPFWQEKGCEKVLYRCDHIIDAATIVVEGEFDAMAIQVAGFDNVVSVPDGAPSINAINYSTKFSYLDNCQARLDEVERFIIAVDGDAPGRKLKDELIRRLGHEKCSIVEWPEGCKDANDVLVKFGPEKLKQVVENAKPCELIFDEWPDPEPLKHSLSPVEPLPMEIVPEPFRDWIKDVSHRMQCPPDFVATAAIVFCGSLIGTKCGIKPKQNDDWIVIPNLWGGVVGRPSMLKTPSLNEALKPLGRLEVKAKESHDEVLMEHQADLVEWEARKDALKSDMKKAALGKGTKSIEQIKDELTDLKKPESPAMTRYKSNDATIEKLSELLNENPNGLLLFRDELVGLLTGWEKPGRESDRAFFLEAWDGTGSHTTDRIGRGTIFTENLCLSLFGGIQPSKLTSYLLQMTGLENDGLVQRLQLLVYPNEKKEWQLVDQRPDWDSRERAYQIIDKLATFDPTDIGATQYDYDRFPSLRFSLEGQEIFNEWLTDLETKKLRSNDHPLILEHLGKYRSLMPTLALIFHIVELMDGGNGAAVSANAATKAAAWCDYYLEPHARRVYGLVCDVGQQSAALLGEKIKQGKLHDRFTIRDVLRKNWHLLNSKVLAQTACEELVDAGWLRAETTAPAFQQKEKVEYTINPKFVQQKPKSQTDIVDTL